MGFIRLHKPPKLCRGKSSDDFTVKEQYYFDLSFSRYSKTEDGKYINDLSSNLLTGEIGSVENVRFIECPLGEIT